ncbi:Mucin-associated surface protein (MASP) [Trypanosoma cruzi]|uniref:Mucin-associated surface protein (MASP), putative n=2 Tax=Trypanosoma cruzi TaxID=5693 RepID=Q4CP30_TRYCC|nr:mucin-associated surface protein (MASP), putative [Trypanosoma cruzi]EAN82033.1 mucin-associated surface protein (MASP), putative [Trypanosoma cruzi]PWV08775.1 Mucin-associated surface protein (MASP) [Trypanosoma cruzi]RNC41212.1 mucin-associated surface protein (MASP) [Trypanosoma cruzi]|eukprot:XP_803884.1 mucin-associated surface protein (MASP) [Trypanosoma cruzi strain CL Brener]
MAMMTGRVLLVCALCVLWCGVCAVVVSAADSGIADASDGHLLHNGSGGGVGGSSPSEAGRPGGTEDAMGKISNVNGSDSAGSVVSGNNLLFSGGGEGGVSDVSKLKLPPVEEGPNDIKNQPQALSGVALPPGVDSTGTSKPDAEKPSSINKSSKGDRTDDVVDISLKKKEELTDVNKEEKTVLPPNDSESPAPTELGAEEGLKGKPASGVASLPAKGEEGLPETGQGEGSPRSEAASSAGKQQDSPTVSQQQTHFSLSPSQNEIVPTPSLGKGRAAEDISKNIPPSGNAVQKEGAQHETVAGGEKPTTPAANTRNTIGKTLPGDSDGSLTTTFSAGPVASRRSTQVSGDAINTDGLNFDVSSDNVAHNNMTAKVENATGSKETVATNSGKSTTVPETFTDKAIGTVTTGDNDGSTAVSHTTSPLLLLLVIACAAAAAVVAA